MFCIYALGNNISEPIEFPRCGRRSSDTNLTLKTVNITITDDNIALENDTFLRYSLGYPNKIELGKPSTVDVVITDDDSLLVHSMVFNFFLLTFVFSLSLVTVTFVSSSYTYNESHGDVSDIQVQLSHPIANSLTVSIVSGMFNDF